MEKSRLYIYIYEYISFREKRWRLATGGGSGGGGVIENIKLGPSPQNWAKLRLKYDTK